MNKLLSAQKPANRHLRASQGFTLVEALIAISVIGILAVMVGPRLFAATKPLQNATYQASGIFKQVRMRAIATTAAYRVRSASATRFTVEAARTRGCEATTSLSAAAAGTATTITVFSTRGFSVGDTISIGSVTRNVTAINEGTLTITLGTTLGTAQPVNTTVELANNWRGIDTTDPNDPIRSEDLITGFTTEDLTLVQPQTNQVRVQYTATPTPWTLCFDSRGIANLFNASGTIVNGNLQLTLQRVDAQTSVQIPGSQTGTVTVFQGGEVATNAQSINE